MGMQTLDQNLTDLVRKGHDLAGRGAFAGPAAGELSGLMATLTRTIDTRGAGSGEIGDLLNSPPHQRAVHAHAESAPHGT